jgi:flagellar motor switch protein FliG
MSMLARFKKQGGLDALLVLLETCGAKKREALMKNIEAEDKAFATMVKTKLLSVERILSWEPLILAEIVPRVQETYLALLIKGYPQSFNTLTYAMKEMPKKSLQTLIDGLNPKPEEIEVACIKFIEKVRECIKDGTVKQDEQGNPVSSVKRVA